MKPPTKGAVLTAAAVTVGSIFWFPQSSPATVGEDSPGFNCYKMGNLSCGPSPIETLPDGTEVAVLAPLDGVTYGSARDGKVYRLDQETGEWTELR